MTKKIILILFVSMLAACQSGASTTTSDLEDPKPGQMAEPVGIEGAKHHFRQGNYGLAERKYRESVEENAANAEAWLGLGATYDQLGRFDLADRAYAQVKKLVGPVPQLMNNIGYSQMLRGKRKSARTYFAKASKSLPDNEVVIGNKQLLAKL